MEKKNVICPHCDSDLIQSHYNYDTGKMNYHCEECNSYFTEDDLIKCDNCNDYCVEGEMIRTEIGTFCCKDCYNEFIKNK